MLIEELERVAYVNRIDVSFMERVHMAIREKAVWEEG